MKEVFLVTCGEYSDYRVIGAFSTKQKAEAFVEARKARSGYNYGDDGIEVYPLDPNEEFIKSGDHYYEAEIKVKSGKLEILSETPPTAVTIGHARSRLSHVYYWHDIGMTMIRVFLLARDTDTARKIVAERRQEFLRLVEIFKSPKEAAEQFNKKYKAP